MSEQHSNPLAMGEPFSFFSLPPCDLGKCGRRDIMNYFDNTYRLDEGMFSAIINEQDFYKCPDRLRLPLIFYIGHTATLYVNKLSLAGLVRMQINPDLEAMFETGVDEMSWDDTENYRLGGAYKWPALKDVLDYRKQVYELLINLINSASLEMPITMESQWWSLFMGIEHERIHIETSSVLLRQMPVTMLQRPLNWKYGPRYAEKPAGTNKFVKVPGGEVKIGKPVAFPSYGWDNEYGELVLSVPEFECSKYLVTNNDFMSFVRSGAYSCREMWTKEGWQWVQFRQAKHPTFWICSEGCKSGCGSDLSCYSHCNLQPHELTEEEPYKYRAIFDVLEMPWDWPVEVNYHEAKAFCTWKGADYRLPTEAEHHRMRGAEASLRDRSSDGFQHPVLQANINLKYGSSTPVNLFPPNSMGLYDVYGNVWEWIEDDFNGLPGFKTSYLYNDYSTSYFDGQHTMIMGGSWITTGDAMSPFTRSAFRRHFYQHTGFRLVRSSGETPVRLCKTEVFIQGVGVIDRSIVVPNVNSKVALIESMNTQFQYETEEKLAAELDKEYHQPDYCNALCCLIDNVIMKYDIKTASALVFGCGVGRSSFELSKRFNKVVGIDYCGRFIDAAKRIQTKIAHGQFTDGLHLMDPTDVEASCIEFKQLTWIPKEVSPTDLVLFEFLERLNNPKAWICRLWECVKPNSFLIILTCSTQCTTSWIQSCLLQWFTLQERMEVAGSYTVSIWQRQ